jgi:hypothetical protein
LHWSVGAAGWLTLELFDLGGRRIESDVREVDAGEEGTLIWRGSRASGVYSYRARLIQEQGRSTVRTGRIVLVR